MPSDALASVAEDVLSASSSSGCRARATAAVAAAAGADGRPLARRAAGLFRGQERGAAEAGDRQDRGRRPRPWRYHAVRYRIVADTRRTRRPAIVHAAPFGASFLILIALTLVSVVIGPVAAAAVLRHGLD